MTQDFSELHKRDMTQPIDERTNVGMVLAMRPWELEVFTRLKHSEKK